MWGQGKKLRVCLAGLTAFLLSGSLAAGEMGQLEKLKLNPEYYHDLTILPEKGDNLGGEVREFVVEKGKSFHYQGLSDVLNGRKKRGVARANIFKVDYASPGKFGVEVKEVAVDAELSIFIDGNLCSKIDLPAEGGRSKLLGAWGVWQRQYDTTYWVDVPAGQHVIRVENSKDNGSWIRITRYILNNYLFGEKYLLALKAVDTKSVEVGVYAGKKNMVTLNLYFIELGAGGIYFNHRLIGTFGGSNDRGEATYAYEFDPGQENSGLLEIRFNDFPYPKWMNFNPNKEGLGLLVKDIGITGIEKTPVTVIAKEMPATVPLVKVAPNKKYFCLDNGQGFYPVGTTLMLAGDDFSGAERFNINWQTSAFSGQKKQVVFNWLTKLARHGVNHLRIVFQDFAAGSKNGFEPELGVYNQQLAGVFDQILDLCSSLRIYVEVSLIDHVDVHEHNAYFERFNKGRNQGYQPFFKSQEAIEWVKKRAVFFAGRCKNRPIVMSYEPFDELSIPPKKDEFAYLSAMESYHAQIADAVKAINKNALVGCAPVRARDERVIAPLELLSRPQIDYASFHLYDWDREKDIKNVEPIIKNSPKPVMLGEGSTFSDPGKFYNALWDMVFSGMAGIRVWYGGYFFLSDEHLEKLKILSLITNQVNWAKIDPVLSSFLHLPEAGEKIQANVPIRYIVDSKDKEFFIWADVSEKPATTLQVTDVTGQYQLTVYNPWNGEILQDEKITANNNINFEFSQPEEKISEIIIHIKK